MAKNPGKTFEEDWDTSCKEQDIYHKRIKDVLIPPDLRERIKTYPNDYDSFIVGKGLFIPIELKSTNMKSIPEGMIRENQVDGLLEADRHDGIYAGFLFNFRSYDNQTYFVPIKAYTTYKENALAGNHKPYKNKVNQKSIPLDICNEIGIEVRNELKRVRYRYFVEEFIDGLKERYK